MSASTPGTVSILMSDPRGSATKRVGLVSAEQGSSDEHAGCSTARTNATMAVRSRYCHCSPCSQQLASHARVGTGGHS